MRSSLATVLLGGWLLIGGHVAAQVPAPIGSEIQVNTYTTGNQRSPVVCGPGDGSFVVVWNGAEGDPLRNNIFAQRYASDGSPAGTEFQVNTYTTGQQERATVCCDGAGNFVVAWIDQNDEDGDNDGVFGQRFASNGGVVGTEFQINTFTTGNQGYPSACCADNGAFVVSWASEDQDGDRDGIFAQRYASTGAPAGTEFPVNTYTTQNQRAPAICCADSGDFVVTWQSADQDGSNVGVFAQRFASSGGLLGSELQVNTFTTESQEDAGICCSAAGDFVVAWESRNQDGSGDGIFGQSFDSGGAPRGDEFQVNGVTTFSQYDPGLSCENGTFVVAWSSQLGGDSYGIFARRFADSGQALGGPVTVSINADGYATSPAVAHRQNGGFVVVWDAAFPDGDEFGVFAQLFELVAESGAPVMSWFGLGGVVLALLAIGLRQSRRAR